MKKNVQALMVLNRALIGAENNATLAGKIKLNTMLKFAQSLPPFVFILIATLLEVSGDAIIRTAIYNNTGVTRIGFILLGGILVFSYGCSLNLAPVEFRQVVGLYIATLFIVWQLISFIAFHSIPSPSIIIGGALIVTGGLIVTFLKF